MEKLNNGSWNVLQAKKEQIDEQTNNKKKIAQVWAGYGKLQWIKKKQLGFDQF